MNVAIIGSGGREHALAYKIKKSKLLGKLYVLPGNPGTSSIAENISIDITDFEAILAFCQSHSVDLVIIGPEKPLVDGLANFLRIHNIAVFGPDKSAALIEGDKSFAKNLMNKFNIPTADYKIFNMENEDEALAYLSLCEYPIVVKASGLAAGKGVMICDDFSKASAAVKLCFNEKKFGNSGDKIIIEQYLQGQEVSVFAITDGTNFMILPASQDHKAIYDGDTGPNTGGMGAYAPVSIIDIYKSFGTMKYSSNEQCLDEIEEIIVKPTIEALKSEKRTFNGCLYCGLMLTIDGPRVIEFNCRFGDPETQAVLMTLDGDLLELLNSTANGQLNTSSVNYNGGASVCVVAVSKGYPNSYEKGFEISGLNNFPTENTVLFHSGTKEFEGRIITDGGRILSTTSFLNKNNIKDVKIIAYEALSHIDYNGIYYRKDISDKAL